MATDLEIGWAAGILDGEGSVVIVQNPDGRLHPCVTVSNTDPVLLERFMSIAVNMGIDRAKLHLHDTRCYNPNPTKSRPGYRIFIGTSVGMTKFLTIVLPQLTTKRRQAELMIEYLKGRGHTARKRISARDREIAKMISALNRGPLGSVETERAALIPQMDEMMSQSELFSDEESPAEMTGPALVKKQA